MSDFHYVRTTGPDGGVDAAEGSAIGLDLEAVLDSGLPPFNVAIQIISAVAEILAIAEEDHVVHGDLDLGDVFVDDTGAVSVEGFGQRETLAPEREPVGPATDRYGLGMVAYALFSPRDLPELPEGDEAHENAAIDAILALNFEGLPEEVISDLQWYLARLLAHDPSDRPTALEAWRSFGGMVELVEGPDFVQWCNAALDGGGERRDEDAASRPMSRGPLSGLDDTTVTGGPLPAGAVNFEGVEDQGRSTAHWTRQGMKQALQRVMNSDYMADPDTDWMPGTPIPPMDRHTGPGTAQKWEGPAPVPKRKPGEGTRRRTKPAEDPISRPLPSDFDLVDPPEKPEDDERTEVGEMVVPTNKPPTPKPRPARKYAPPKDSPTVPSPGMVHTPPPAPVAPTRPQRRPQGPAPDPDTIPPQLVKRPPSPTKPPIESEPTPAPVVGGDMGSISPAAESAPVAMQAQPPVVQQQAPMARPDQPIPEYVPRGPDPFADVEEESGSNAILIGGIAMVLVVSIVFCVGVGGVGGLAAIMGMPTASTPQPAPRTRIVKAEPEPGNVAVATEPSPDPSPRMPTLPGRPTSRPSPSPVSAPVPSSPRPSPSPAPQPSPSPVGSPSLPSLPGPSAQPSSVRPSSVRPSSVRPSSPVPSPMPFPSPVPSPMPSPMPFPAPSGPSSTSYPPPSLPPLPIDNGDSILPYLVPEPGPRPDGSGPSMLQNNMRAHLTTATAARNAVIAGDAAGAKAAAQGLEFINPPDALPPDWLPYVVDLKMEAWLMENSPDIAAAGFKVAQIGQACATCHEGVRAGPTVTPTAVPARLFDEQEVMKRHAWAVDWMWVGLLANDQAAWSKGANELAEAPFPSVILQDFPDQRFMDLEDKLHDLAVEGQAATNPDKRALVFGKMLSTCARCHAVYRQNK
ncbi:MAG: hypothetical protein H6737_08430 [Alphaproteobacteria bacterium]|nr:hypothetical protein [Alphaproteobacteria bacterium]